MFTKTFALSLLVFAVCATSRADITVLNSVDPNLLTGKFVDGNNNPTTGFSMGTTIAESFVTGGSVLTLSNVVFPQIYQTGSGATAVNNNGFLSTETFALFTDSTLSGANRPGVSLFNFTLKNDTTVSATANPAAFGETTATVPLLAVGLATLLPNTRYWLVLSNATLVSWNYLNGTSYSSARGFTIPLTNTTITDDPTSTPVEFVGNLSDGPQQFVLNVVPEPSTYCLMAVAGLALVVSRKRARKLAV